MAAKQDKQLLTEFLQMKDEEVLDRFARVPNAVVNKQWVYLAGNRKDRVLLVAHADTVRHERTPLNVLWLGDVALRPDSNNGDWNHAAALGGDDRAGCAALWSLWNGQHSVLITTGEERGLIGAKDVAGRMQEELSKHSFMIEVDRLGHGQAVFYDVSTKPFEKYMMALLDAQDPLQLKWSLENGSSTDIRELCPAAGICGVNLSAGYMAAHSKQEMLLLGAWRRTRDTLYHLLKQPMQRWELPERGWLSRGYNRYGAAGDTPPYTSQTDLERVVFGLDSSNGQELFRFDDAEERMLRQGFFRPIHLAGMGWVGNATAAATQLKWFLVQRVARDFLGSVGLTLGKKGLKKATKRLDRLRSLKYIDDLMHARLDKELIRRAEVVQPSSGGEQKKSGVLAISHPDEVFQNSVVLCEHTCRFCPVESSSVWTHRRVGAVKCDLFWDSLCSEHSPYTRNKVGEAENSVELWLAQHSKKVTVPQLATEPAKVPILKVNEEGWCFHRCDQAQSPNSGFQGHGWRHRQSLGGKICNYKLRYDTRCPWHMPLEQARISFGVDAVQELRLNEQKKTDKRPVH